MKPALEWLGRSVRAFAHNRAHAGDGDCKPRHGHCGCCTIPESCCPPRCVGDIKWKIERGAAPEATVQVRNAGKLQREFAFAASPLAGHDPGSAKISVTPAVATLQPGQATLVRIRLDDSLALRACQDYHAELLVRGSWEQCVRVFIHVTNDPFVKLELEQSDSAKDKLLHPRTYKRAIAWKIERGVVPEAAITVRNAGKSAQAFGFEATPLVGPAAPGARVVALPDALQLEPGQSGLVRLKLQGSAALGPGQSYGCELLVHGFYEQSVEVKTYVEPDAAGHALVEQGEAPVRRRAHHWYDHFQCTEHCAAHSR